MNRALPLLCLLLSACDGYCPGGDDWAVGESFSYTLQPGEEACFFTPRSSSEGLQLRSTTSDEAFGDVQIRDGEDETMIVNGWCCVTPNEHWTLLDGTDVSRANHAIFRNGADAGTTTTSFSWHETGSGASVSDPAPFLTGSGGWYANNMILDAGQSLYFTMSPGAGGYQLIIDGMDWSETKAPAHAKLFTDAADPTGSSLLDCTSEMVDGGTRYSATCDVTLPDGAVFLQIDQAGSGTDVLFSARLEG